MGGASFFDFDGTLADTNLVSIYAFYARHAGRRGDFLARNARLLASVPAFYALDAVSRLSFANYLYGMYKGFSLDRLEALAPSLHERVIARKVFKGTPDLVARAKEKGPAVLVTGAADFTIRRFAEEHGFDDVIATRLEFKNGIATGHILPPPVFGPNKARAIREWAASHGVDLAASTAYSDSVSDVDMFAVVGRAAVVNPDARLARLARQYHWPVLRVE